jgi:hypothetical protein
MRKPDKNVSEAILDCRAHRNQGNSTSYYICEELLEDQFGRTWRDCTL